MFSEGFCFVLQTCQPPGFPGILPGSDVNPGFPDSDLKSRVFMNYAQTQTWFEPPTWNHFAEISRYFRHGSKFATNILISQKRSSGFTFHYLTSFPCVVASFNVVVVSFYAVAVSFSTFVASFLTVVESFSAFVASLSIVVASFSGVVSLFSGVVASFTALYTSFLSSLDIVSVRGGSTIGVWGCAPPK